MASRQAADGPGQAAVCGVRGGDAPYRSGSGSCPTLGGGGKLPGGDSAATAAYVPLPSLFRSRAPRRALLSHRHTSGTAACHCVQV